VGVRGVVKCLVFKKIGKHLEISRALFRVFNA